MSLANLSLGYIEGRGGWAQAESSTDAKVRNLTGSIVRERVIINLNCGHGLPELGATYTVYKGLYNETTVTQTMPLALRAKEV